MKTMREKFEALPEIEKHLVFIDDFYDNKYHSMNNSSVTDFINGAWYAFQEQQKKIDDFVNIIHDAYMSNGNSSVEIVYDKIQELLK